jgi:hypothetical protein
MEIRLYVIIELHGMYLSLIVYTSSNVLKTHSIYTYAPIKTRHMVNGLIAAQGDHWAKIVEQRAIKNRVQYIHCR